MTTIHHYYRYSKSGYIFTSIKLPRHTCSMWVSPLKSFVKIHDSFLGKNNKKKSLKLILLKYFQFLVSPFLFIINLISIKKHDLIMNSARWRITDCVIYTPRQKLHIFRKCDIFLKLELLHFYNMTFEKMLILLILNTPFFCASSKFAYMSA